MFPKVLYFDMACEKPVPPVNLPPPCFSFFYTAQRFKFEDKGVDCMHPCLG